METQRNKYVTEVKLGCRVTVLYEIINTFGLYKMQIIVRKDVY